MPDKRQKIQSVLNAADFPGEILTGVPVVELHGDSEAVILNHRGVMAYGAEEVRVGSAIGTVFVEGDRLEIHRMNRERIVLHGRIRSVRVGGGEKC